VAVSFVQVVPSKVVEVLADGGWHRGEFEGWRRDGVRWVGYVRWSTGVGMRRLGWVEATDSGLVFQQPRWTDATRPPYGPTERQMVRLW
jgi:hypothetical protein